MRARGQRRSGRGGRAGRVFFLLLSRGRTRDGGLQPDGDPACDPTTRRRFSVWHYNRDCRCLPGSETVPRERKPTPAETLARASDGLPAGERYRDSTEQPKSGSFPPRDRVHFFIIFRPPPPLLRALSARLHVTLSRIEEPTAAFRHESGMFYADERFVSRRNCILRKEMSVFFTTAGFYLRKGTEAK